MAFLLRAAEDLLEGVDRRAKLVVSELSDDHFDSKPSASNGQDVQSRRTKSKEKGQSRASSIETSRSTKHDTDQRIVQLPLTNMENDKVENSPYNDDTNHASISSSNMPSDTNKDEIISDITTSGIAQAEGGNDTLTAVDIPVMKSNMDVMYSDNGGDRNDDIIETINGDHLVDDPKVNSVDKDAVLIVDQARPESDEVKEEKGSNGQENDRVILPESSPNRSKQSELKIDTSAMKVQEQLEEAQGLLKGAVSTGNSKQARLTRVCAGLSSRLQEYKSENAQLEELLVAERKRVSSFEARIKQLQQNLSASKSEMARVESNTAESLAAKNSEIDILVGSMDTLKKQAAASEERLASLQANMDTIIRSRELTETRMIQALREELASAERRAEEERAAHNSTKMAAVEREVELEHRAVETSTALARLQRTADESTSRAMDLEHKVALLEVECATLNRELQDVESRTRRGQKKSSEEDNQVLQAWKEEVERARQGQRDAENKVSYLEADLQKLRVEMAGVKREAEHYSRQEHVELEKRYRELADLLYHKQTQLEAMASEKAATEFQLEKEIKRFQETQVEAERSKAFRRAPTLWEEDTDIKSLEPLPLHHRHMVGASIQIQRAAKLLDTGAVRATRFLWRYPVARVILLFYLVFVHLFLMYLLHRLQEQADDFSSRDLAASMGLGNSSLP